MSILTRLFTSTITAAALPILHPRENQRRSGTINSIAGELILDGVDGCNSLSIDVRGTYTIMVFEVSGTINGTDWITIPLVNKDPGAFKAIIASITASTTGAWEADIAAYQAVRVRNSSGTTPTGSANITMVASNAPLSRMVVRDATFRSPTTLGALGALTTHTIAAPGVGLRQYITRITIDRINATVGALTAAATPITISTTSLPDSLAFSAPADALPAGAIATIDKDYTARPIPASTQNTTITIACPATAGVIWRITTPYFVAP